MSWCFKRLSLYYIFKVHCDFQLSFKTVGENTIMTVQWKPHGSLIIISFRRIKECEIKPRRTELTCLSSPPCCSGGSSVSSAPPPTSPVSDPLQHTYAQCKHAHASTERVKRCFQSFEVMFMSLVHQMFVSFNNTNRCSRGFCSINGTV